MYSRGEKAKLIAMTAVFFGLLYFALAVCKASLRILNEFYAEYGGNHLVTALVVITTVAMILDKRKRK